MKCEEFIMTVSRKKWMPPPMYRWTKKRYPRIPTHIDRVYGEIIEAYNAGLVILSMAGLRIVFQLIATEIGAEVYHRVWKRIPAEYFDDEIRTRQSIKKKLQEAWEWGNKAIHEGRAPEVGELIRALGRIDMLLMLFYKHEFKKK